MWKTERSWKRVLAISRIYFHERRSWIMAHFWTKTTKTILVHKKQSIHTVYAVGHVCLRFRQGRGSPQQWAQKGSLRATVLYQWPRNKAWVKPATMRCCGVQAWVLFVSLCAFICGEGRVYAFSGSKPLFVAAGPYRSHLGGARRIRNTSNRSRQNEAWCVSCCNALQRPLSLVPVRDYTSVGMDTRHYLQ